MYRTTLRGEVFTFQSLPEVFGRAGDEKSGDVLAGVAARSEMERIAARTVLADITVGEIVDEPFVDDEVTSTILGALDTEALSSIRSRTIGELREAILEPDFVEVWGAGLQRGISPEVAAAVAKLMSSRDLITAASRLRVITRCCNTVGEQGVLAARLQPNHPTDDLAGILFSALDGVLFGCGDAVIGVNPAGDSIEGVDALSRGLRSFIDSLGLPTQACVLAHISTQMAAIERGTPIDLLFQSIAGTEAANASFGVSIAQLAEGREMVLDSHKSDTRYIGDQVMYFETGQGSALSANAHHGIDQLTCEARAQGVARCFDPFLVNSVVGFIGPEYLANDRQIIRAGLEDHFVGKLLGLPMGLDICYTNHVDADQDTTDQLLVLVATAGCNFVMSVAGSDDIMLNYQSTSAHDVVGVRDLLGLRPAPEFAQWLEEVGIYRSGHLAPEAARGIESATRLSGALTAIGRGDD